MSRDEAVLLDIVGAARQILAFKQDMPKEAFFDDAKTQSAILHQLMIMGEAVKRLSQGFRTQHSEYDAVGLDEVWKTAHVDVPKLLSKLEPLLPQAPDAEV